MRAWVGDLAGTELHDRSHHPALLLCDQLEHGAERGGVVRGAQHGADAERVDRRPLLQQPLDPVLVEVSGGEDAGVVQTGCVEAREM